MSTLRLSKVSEDYLEQIKEYIAYDYAKEKYAKKRL